MSRLEEFEKRLAAELARGELPSHAPADVGQQMTEINRRHARFQQTSERLRAEVICPRIEGLAAHFENAKLLEPRDPLHCTCWFGYSLRCPANLRLDLGLSHDEQIQELVVSYELQIVPVFIKYDRYDRFLVPLEDAQNDTVAQWVEDKLIEFVHTYQRLERTDRDQAEVLVTDPVCSMRLLRSDAAGTHEYRGHPYYFCSAGCRTRFADDPLRFVTLQLD